MVIDRAKRAVGLWIVVSVVAATAGQVDADDQLVVRRSTVNGLARSLTTVHGGPIPLAVKAGRTTVDAEDVLAEYGELFGIADAGGQLRKTAAREDRLGQRHTTFQQLHKDVPVFGGVLKVHQDAAGRVLAVNGSGFRIPAELTTRPTLTGDEARALATRQAVALAPEAVSSELVVVDPGWYGDPPRGPHLAFHVVVACPLSGLLEAFFVDAHCGEILDRWSLVFHDRERRVFDGLGAPGLPGSLARAEGDAPVEPVGDPVVDDINSAYDYMGDVYAFFANAFGRDSIDDFGLPLVATVNSTALGGGCPSAFFNTDFREVVFCLGRVPDDVVGHEFTHGLTFYTANFIYQNQGGALHEHFSFVFGETIDLVNSGSETAGPDLGPPSWSGHPSGVGIDQPNERRTACSRAPDYSDGVRWLYNEDRIGHEGATYDLWDPTCFGSPDRALSPLQECPESNNGGTHIAAGIPNHAFALVVDGGAFNGFTVEGIGLVKAAHVWYRALTTYLTAGSDFQDAYWAFNRAASDLVGSFPADPRSGEPSSSMFSAHDAAQVEAALKAVEMDTPGRCGQSTEVLEPGEAPRCSAERILLDESFDGGMPAGWQTSSSEPPTDYQWRVTEAAEPLPYGRAGRAAFCPDLSTPCIAANESARHSLLTPPVVIPTDAAFPILEFTHLMGSEPYIDGGNLSFRVDGGVWQRLPAAAFLRNGYNQRLLGAIQGNSNPLGGQLAFAGGGGGWGTSQVALAGLVAAGQTIQLRFDFGKDRCDGYVGWYLDDVRIVVCDSAVDCDDDGTPDELQLAVGDADEVVVRHPSGHSERSFSDADVFGTTRNVLAERFLLFTAKRVRAIRIWGGYYPMNSSPDDHFTVIIHAPDQSSGLPGAVLSEQSPAMTSAVETGFRLDGINELEITLTLRDPLSLQPGAYWVEIYADTSDRFDGFVWSRAEFEPPLVHTATSDQAPGAEWTVNGSSHQAIEIVVDPAGADCNGNGLLDACDLAAGRSVDGNADGVPDECQPTAPRRSSGPLGG